MQPTAQAVGKTGKQISPSGAKEHPHPEGNEPTMTAAINLNQLARICAGRMLNCTLEGVAIGLFAWILLRVAGRRNSSTRFAVWFSALLVIASLPILGADARSARAAIAVPGSWALVIFAIWAAVAALALSRVSVGLWQLRKLRASCTPMDATTLHPLLRATLQGFQAVRSVELCQSNRVPVPTAIGFLKPAVVIPTWALQELSTPELNSILIHELAHLRRWDDWTNLIQQILKALLFFHPAVWWIEGKLALEREMACDDAVLAETANPRGYAQCLIAMAEKSFMRRGLAMAQAVVNRVHQTALRVSQILDVNRSSATRVWKPALYSVAAFSVVCLVSFSHAPELVTFKDWMPEVTVASAKPANEMLTAFAGSNVPRLREGTSVLVPQRADRKSGFQPLRRRISNQSGSSASLLDVRLIQPRAARIPRTSPATIGDEATPQAVFVVMQTAQYEETGPVLWTIYVWRVTVLHPSRIPVETRIPAKQI
jgi:beta-lactamase regulating signal transducer with metallopeptidase domain